MPMIFEASAPSVPAAAPSPTRHYLALDGLRGVAAIGVVTYHICGYFRLGFAPAHAYLAVDFFFMLSGFVIAHAYDRRLASGFGVLGFLAVRLVRLYPLVLLGLAIGTALFLMRAVSTHEMRAGSVLLAAATNALLLPSPALTYLRPWAFPTDTPLWSLAFELWVNILYAATFKFTPRAGLMAALAVGGVLVVWTSLAFGGLNVGYAWHDFYLGGARVLFPFLMGVLLARRLRGHAVRLPWAHVMFVLLILVLSAPRGAGRVVRRCGGAAGFPRDPGLRRPGRPAGAAGPALALARRRVLPGLCAALPVRRHALQPDEGASSQRRCAGWGGLVHPGAGAGRFQPGKPVL
jgi:peptidoglycan/LPS O-acetylase OafA/YrhL